VKPTDLAKEQREISRYKFGKRNKTDQVSRILSFFHLSLKDQPDTINYSAIIVLCGFERYAWQLKAENISMRDFWLNGNSGYCYNRIAQLFKVLLDAGLIGKEGRGKYYLTIKGRKLIHTVNYRINRYINLFVRGQR